MNLINDAWIPVRRADGSIEKIEPWRITEDIADDKRRILAVATPRPDFDGALVQFLIGLLQTTCTPKDQYTWRQWRKEKVPIPDQLRSTFCQIADAFYLYREDGPIFMQERLGEKGERHPVAYLLIGSPTDATLKLGTDHFLKRPTRKEYLCAHCAATALFTLQSFAPSGGGGGDGKFTSLRGGGPLTTLILGSNLWESLWLNVIFGSTFSVRQPNEKIFPWLKLESFITNESTIKTIHSVDMHPEHVFWGMPRRIQLLFSSQQVAGQKEPCSCAICESTDEILCTSFRDTTGGLTYQHELAVAGQDGRIKKTKFPSWISPRHPQSPYNQGLDKMNPPTAVHPQEGGIGYRHWLGLIVNSITAKIERIPAAAVEQYRLVQEDGRMWAFGYDMDNMKARCWYDSVMPILFMPEGEDGLILFKACVEQSIKAAEEVAKELRKRIKTALVGDGEMRGDLSFVASHFWGITEPAFYEHAYRLRDLFQSGQNEQMEIEQWHSELQKWALATFDRFANTGDFDIVNPRRIAQSRNLLGRFLSGKKLREVLGLPYPRKNRA